MGADEAADWGLSWWLSAVFSKLPLHEANEWWLKGTTTNNLLFNGKAEWKILLFGGSGYVLTTVGAREEKHSQFRIKLIYGSVGRNAAIKGRPRQLRAGGPSPKDRCYTLIIRLRCVCIITNKSRLHALIEIGVPLLFGRAVHTGIDELIEERYILWTVWRLRIQHVVRECLPFWIFHPGVC